MDREKDQVTAAQKGDTSAFTQLVQTYETRVFALACRMTGSRAAAEELTQETFLRAYQSLAGFDHRSAFFTWLYRIAVNLCLRYLAQQQPLTFADWPPLPEEPSGADPALDPEQALLREEVKVGCLTGLVRCLPAEQRSAFVLATLLELPDRDVAAALECSVDAVKARLTRARDSLGRFLERRCQWIDEHNACRCHRYIAMSLAKGLISGSELACDTQTIAAARETTAEIGRIRGVVALYRDLPAPRGTESLVARIRQGIASGEWRILR